MNNKFDIKKETIDTLINVYKMQIPDFQRKFVWNDTKKKELIDSLIRNYPIGALTLYNNIDEKSYLLVDGLQRYNTIYSYLKNPSQILNFNEYYMAANFDDSISNFCRENNIDEKKLKKNIKRWYQSLGLQNEYSGFTFENMKNLLDNLSDFDNLFNDIDKFQKLRDLLLKVINIRYRSIPLIIYEGDKNDLPDLFTKINKKNISLTPYEILHSMWYNYTMPYCYKDINYKNIFIDNLKNDENFVFDTTRNIDKFNIYMYFVSLGYKYISNIKSNDFANKNILNRFGKEIIFDAFSTIKCGQSNKISSVIDELCKNRNESIYSSEIFYMGEKLLNCINELNEFIIENKIEFINSKYFYLYLLYIIFNKNNENNIGLTVNFIKNISDLNWFKDKFRQINFFNSRIIDYNTYNSSQSNIFSYIENENLVIKYSFIKNNLNQLDGINKNIK